MLKFISYGRRSKLILDERGKDEVRSQMHVREQFENGNFDKTHVKIAYIATAYESFSHVNFFFHISYGKHKLRPAIYGD